MVTHLPQNEDCGVGTDGEHSSLCIGKSAAKANVAFDRLDWDAMVNTRPLTRPASNPSIPFDTTCFRDVGGTFEIIIPQTKILENGTKDEKDEKD